jgi:predicted LPLAT superfamily acyltransferase
VHWTSVPELGTALGVRLLTTTLRLGGRPVAAALLWLVCWYYVATHDVARAASRALFARLGEPLDARRLHRHLWTFARVSLDRALFLAGETRSLALELHGHETVMSQARNGRGALLLGAHLGSFEAMRALAAHYDVPMLVVVDFHNARRITATLGADAVKQRVRLLDLAPEDPLALLQVKEAIDRGELVAMLGDRPTGRADRDVVTDFLGAPARFPGGPLLLASVLDCPVFFVCALFDAPRTYRVHCVPLFERVELPRRQRHAALARHVAHYAHTLERFTREAPFNWFNFFPFWLA